MKPTLSVILLALSVTLAAPAYAEETPSDTAHRKDTILYVPQMQQRPAESVTNASNLEKHLVQNPTAALFKSMAVPGLGQIGNRRIIKAGIFIGLESWFAIKAIQHGQAAHDIRASFEAETDPAARVDIYNRYSNERSKRNKFVWFFGLTTFVSMFDAYVDAHLSGSPSNPRNDQFSFDVGPDPRGGALAMFTLRF